jgi:hypothetical protein
MRTLWGRCRFEQRVKPMEDNPYVAPKIPEGVPPSTADREVAKRLVRGPATSLIVLSVIAMLLDVLVIANVMVHDAPLILEQHGQGEGMQIVAANVSVNSLLFLVHLIVLIGAVQMLRLGSYSNAMTSAVVSLIPFCSPVVLLGLPFGVWALVVLCKARVSAVFKANAEP